MDKVPYRCPLGDEHCANLDRVLAETPGKIQLCKDCIADGVDFSEQQAVLEAQMELAKKLKARHFPHKA
jgi:hypothetical protein